MKIIHGPRQSGKSTALVEAAIADPNGAILVPHVHDMERLVAMFPDKLARSTDPRPYSYTPVFCAVDYKRLTNLSYDLYIDDLDALLSMLFDNPVYAASLGEFLSVPKTPVHPEVDEPVETEEALFVSCEDCNTRYRVSGPEEALDKTREHKGHKVKVGKQKVGSPKKVNRGFQKPTALIGSAEDRPTVEFVASLVKMPAEDVMGWTTQYYANRDALKFTVAVAGYPELLHSAIVCYLLPPGMLDAVVDPKWDYNLRYAQRTSPTTEKWLKAQKSRS